MCKFSNFNFKALTGAFFIRGGIKIPPYPHFEARRAFTEMRLEI